MTPEEAFDKAEALNSKGLHKKEWFYYPSKATNGWFVMRRRKLAEVTPAVYCDGSLAIWETFE